MSDVEQEKYVKDTRIPCKYGVECYQKNPFHHAKYKHPPKKESNQNIKHARKKMKVATNKVTKEVITKTDVSDSDDYNSDNSDKNCNKATKNFTNDVSDSDETDVEENERKNVSEVKENTGINKEVKKLVIEDDKNKTIESTKDKETKNVSSGESTSGVNDVNGVKQTENNINKGFKDPPDDSDIKSFDNSKSNEENETSGKENIAEMSSAIDTERYDLNPKKFIKEKFLVDMPEDFYQFWNFCKTIKKNNPLEAFKEVGLTLVGPFDVLAGKFNNVRKSAEEYLIHWRYYRDPPETQTVLKGDVNTGYHIGYFRDSPEKAPVFLVSNSAKKDGVMTQMGGNIFAAVNMYLEELKTSGNPFQKIHIGKIQTLLRSEAEKLKVNLSKKTEAMISREKKIVTRTFNKVGLVVPYDRKTQVGYRELALGNKDLSGLLNKLQTCLPEQKPKYLSQLQQVFTYASIAADECDFGTGIELGWNIISHGLDDLNSTALTFLTTNYRLLNREAFAKIAEAHMNNRKKGCDLSII